MSVLELCDDVNCVNICEKFQAHLVILEVVEKKKDNSDDLLLAEVVENLSNSLNDLQSVVFKALQGEWVIGNDPEGVDHVIGNLVALKTLIVQVSME